MVTVTPSDRHEMKWLPSPTISFKVKARPEDFHVVEVADLMPGDRGEYRLYRLTKVGWNTTDLLLRLATRFGVPYQAFSYGGKKDRHALTEQYITIRDQRDFSLREKDYRLEFLGFTHRPMAPLCIRGNHFLITLRALKDAEIPSLQWNLQAVQAQGVPNYFDDQRFRSYDRKRGFIAEKLLKGEWEEGLKMYLTSQYPSHALRTRQRRQFFLDHWWQWDRCLERAQTATERIIFGYLRRRGGNYVGAMNLVPREDLSLMLAAYQSYLWNEMVGEIISRLASHRVCVSGVANYYLFYTDLTEKAFDYLRKLWLPLPGPNPTFPDSYAQQIYDLTLGHAGLESDAFALKNLYRAYFTSFARDVVVIPQGLELLDLSRDDLYPRRLKATLSFFLPRGAYGTMVLKRLTVKLRPPASGSEETAGRPG